MSKRIHIGDASIPLDSYAIGGTALLGIRASGKTYCAKGIAEQLLEHRVPIIVFDPIGVWRHLKVPANKHGKGYPVVVAGGRGADLPLTPQSAQEIVRAAMRENIPLVVDLYDKTMSKGDWRRIVQTCFRTLLYENEGVRHIFLEEAAEYVPQKVMDGETYAEVEKLVRMGGNASLGITLINQRAQEVNKAVLDLCENLVLMRQMGAHAIDALEKWIDKVSPDFAGKIAAGMPKMTAGECWVFAGGAEKPIFTRSATIRTYHPDRKNPDAKIVAAATDTSAFVEALQRALPAIVEQQQANDPKKLKAKIAELERQVRDAPAARASVDNLALATEQSERILTLERDNRALEQHRDDIAAAFHDLRERVEDLTHGPLPEIAGIIETARKEFGTLPAFPPFPTITKPSAPAPAARTSQTRLALPSRPVAASAPRSRKMNGGELSSSLSAGPRQCLTAIAQYAARGGVSMSQMKALTGYATRSVTTHVSQLRVAGYIENGWPLFPTDAGIAALGDYDPLPLGDELREYWLRELPEGPRRILELLVAARPQGLNNAEIVERSDYALRSVTTHVSALKARCVVTKAGGRFHASEELFG